MASKTDLIGTSSPSFSGRSTRIEAVGRTSSANAFSSLPNQSNAYAKTVPDIDEFGYGRSNSKITAATMDPAGYGSRPTIGNQHSSSRSTNQPIATSTPTATRTTRTGSNAAVNRFTITNAVPSDTSSISESSHKRKPSANATSSPSGSPSRGVWLTAEQEKERLYQKAKERVEKVQGSAGRGDLEVRFIT